MPTKLQRLVLAFNIKRKSSKENALSKALKSWIFIQFKDAYLGPTKTLVA